MKIMSKLSNEEKQIRKDEYYLNIAESVAMKSTCLRRAYGAIIVNNDEIIATGYNGSPRGCINCDEIGCMREAIGIGKGDAYNLCASVHAEQNAIISAPRRDMIGATIYIVGVNQKPELAMTARYADPSPCLICHRLIINAGIARCVGRINANEADDELITFKEIDISNEAFMRRVEAEYDRAIDQISVQRDPNQLRNVRNAEKLIDAHKAICRARYGDNAGYTSTAGWCEHCESFQSSVTGKTTPCCMLYSKTKRADGLHWAHYPECEPENCPKLHPELLDDAKRSPRQSGGRDDG